jgi:GT2 family glycosyltransferase
MASGIAVIIVNWNSGQLLRQCVAALTNQTAIVDSIVVVDNASSDGSLAAVEGSYPQVKIIRLDRNIGFAEGNNIGIDAVQNFDWIALVNPDVFPEPQWLEKLLNSTRSYPGYTFYASRMMTNADRTILDGAGDTYHTSGAAWRRGHGTKYHAGAIEKGEVFGACAAAALYWREALVEVDGFDAKYFCYFEDVDLAFRLRLAGYRGLYVPDAIVRHIGSATTGKGSDFMIYHGHRNLVWTYFKDMPWLLFWLYLPQHLLLNLASILWFTLRGRGKVILKAKWDALRGLPRILEKRRQIQKNRRVGAWELRRAMAKGLLTPYLRRHG